MRQACVIRRHVAGRIPFNPLPRLTKFDPRYCEDYSKRDCFLSVLIRIVKRRSFTVYWYAGAIKWNRIPGICLIYRLKTAQLERSRTTPKEGRVPVLNQVLQLKGEEITSYIELLSVLSIRTKRSFRVCCILALLCWLCCDCWGFCSGR